MDENYFGEDVAAGYDATTGEWGEPQVIGAAVAFLAELAGDGAALELGIGTGRIALPLAARGVPVQGIDLSEAMVARLREKPGSAEIPVAIGDFSTTRVEGHFLLAYIVYNTIMNLRTQQAQVTCFDNVAAHLQPGGCFVAEIMLPELQRLSPGERFLPFSVEADHLGLDEYDLPSQGLTSHHYFPDTGAYSTFPGRYVWPSELDLWRGWQE
jgi:SAM-dependent methyltransferase